MDTPQNNTPALTQKCLICGARGNSFSLPLSSSCDHSYEAWYCLACDWRGFVRTTLSGERCLEAFSWAAYPDPDFPKSLPAPFRP